MLKRLTLYLSFVRFSHSVFALPFALAGAWTSYYVALLIYAAASFFIVQRVRHQSELTGS